MIPIRDANPTSIKPIINWALIAFTVFAFVYLQPHSEPDATEFAYEYAAIPCELTTGDPIEPVELKSDTCRPEPSSPAIFPSKSIPLSVLASIFLHGSWGHIIGNMWMLWIFGNNVEEAFGSAGFLLFYLIAGTVATLGYTLVNADSVIPLIGASGAIAGVMGAYLVLYPRARVVSVFPLFWLIPVALPATLFLLIWFGSQFLLAGGTSGVAWEAHVAGFLFGALVALLLRPRLRTHRSRRNQAYRY